MSTFTLKKILSISTTRISMICLSASLSLGASLSLSLTLANANDETCISKQAKQLTGIQEQISQLSASACVAKKKLNEVEVVYENPSFDFLSNPKALSDLQKGVTYTKMIFNVPVIEEKLGSDGFAILKALVSLKSPKSSDPRVHFFPSIDVKQLPQSGLKAIISKSTYLIPGISSKNISAEKLASDEYHTYCQPGIKDEMTELDKDPAKKSTDPNVFRIKKTLVKIPLVPKKLTTLTIQMNVSAIKDEETIKSIASLDNGLNSDGYFLMERSVLHEHLSEDELQHPLARSVLVYKNVKDGLLVTNYTVVLTMGGKLMNLITKAADIPKESIYSVKETTNGSREFFATAEAK